MKVELVVVEGPHAGKRYSFDRHDHFIVGRGVNSHFRLPKNDVFFSRHHFLIEVNPPLCRLLDLKSSNGTFVNGKRVTCCDLKDGDAIKGGDTVLQVSILAGEKVDTTRPIEAKPTPEVPGPVASTPDTTLARPLARLPSPGDLAKAAKLQQPFAGYAIIEELGKGGMGVVYRAICERTQTLVALKVILPAPGAEERDLAIFLRESEILQAFTHPHIVPFRDMGQCRGKLFFVMDFVNGRDANHLLKESHGGIPVARGVAIAKQMLAALGAAHDAGFVHRDVKPGNVLIEPRSGQDYVWLADFGLAREYQSSRVSGLTRTGDFGGTIAFMAPEQITDFRNVGPAADQYSVAATLYYFLTGQPIYDFPADTAKQLLKILQEAPVPIESRRRDLPAGLAQAISKALAREPRERFASASAFSQALAAAG
jgi:serine/threonine-protein kinase